MHASLMAAKANPPASLLEDFLTPPLIAEKPLSRSGARVLNCFKLHRAGVRPQPWWQHRLPPGDYSKVLNVLVRDENLQNYVEDKVRYDYEPRHSYLSFRMPSPVHNIFCAGIAEEVLRQLKQFEQTEGCADFAKEIVHLATSRLIIPTEMADEKQTYARREPDASFKHRPARFPGVIIEMCYSQKSKAISRLADEYILDTDGSVNAVIGLDVDYIGSKKATLTVWQPEYTIVDGIEELQATAVIDALAFRTDAGLPTDGVTLRIPLKNFATENLTKGDTNLNKGIYITSTQLCEFLLRAESEQRMETLQQGSTNQLRPGAGKRRRSQTPPEQLSSGEDQRGRLGIDLRLHSSSGSSLSNNR
ncbi:hypothetical protein N7456_007429 [Penicillium angulare]|uniref:Uncharacterized protein n=1 Tax=Penicillium angulare TaxID=116970 RepID=A0A9W9FAN8_9EURO|nr:hypothetical protein N7456_007429 [Penicillium angulare]